MRSDRFLRAIPVILCSAATRQVQEAAASFAGKGIIWLEKPFELETLLNLLETIDDNPEAKLRTLPIDDQRPATNDRRTKN